MTNYIQLLPQHTKNNRMIRKPCIFREIPDLGISEDNGKVSQKPILDERERERWRRTNAAPNTAQPNSESSQHLQTLARPETRSYSLLIYGAH